MTSDEIQSGTETVARDEASVREPRSYKIVLLNDDYTTMDFVVSVLEGIFKKSPAEAVRIMLAVHHNGKGVCGIYSRESAEAKLLQVHGRARSAGFPLRGVMEEA